MNRIILLAGIFMIIAIACRKENRKKVTKLQIDLNQSVFAVTDVDSAEIVLQPE